MSDSGRGASRVDEARGCEQVNLHHTSRRAIIRHHGSAEHIAGLEPQGWENGEAEGLDRLQVDGRDAQWRDAPLLPLRTTLSA